MIFTDKVPMGLSPSSAEGADILCACSVCVSSGGTGATKLFLEWIMNEAKMQTRTKMILPAERSRIKVLSALTNDFFIKNTVLLSPF